MPRDTLVDVGADVPIPGVGSLVCFGAVIVDDDLSRTFFGKLKPISEKFLADALAVSGFSPEEKLSFDESIHVINDFRTCSATESS